MPEVSVIMPTYNRAHLVDRAIQSVLNQTFQDFEIIVINNYSKDNTIDVINSFNDKRIKLINFRNNGIIAKSRNQGLMKSAGDYIAFLDDDDIWEPEKLEKQIEVLRNAPEAVGAVYTGMILLDKQGRIIKKVIPKYRGNIFYLLLTKSYIDSASALVVKKECFEHVGFFDESEDLGVGDDWDMWIRIAQHYKFNFIPEVLVKIYFHGKNITTNTPLTIKRHKAITAKYEKYITASPRKIRAAHYLYGGIILWRSGDIKDGKKFFIKSIFANPLTIFDILSFISLDTSSKFLNRIRRMKKTLLRWILD
jgi:glycosyltransferase involved in cell wall biosynthesis